MWYLVRTQVVVVYMKPLIALVVYDYILTISQEATVVWRRKWTGATVIFLSNRYLLLASIILQALPSWPGNVSTLR